MVELDIFYLFLFVLSVLYTLNVFVKIVKTILSDEPQKINFGNWEKISNYLFFTYLITYLIVKIF
jgi:hypothetical protein